MKGKYTAFGLNIESELELPELTASEGPADVSIVFGETPRHLEAPAAETPWYEVKAGEFLLTVDSVARYYAGNGRCIVVEPVEGADEESVRVFLLESVFPALLQQRGYLALHGSAAVIRGKAVAIAGKSSAGKTAVALALYDRGFSLLTDEICALGVSGDGKLMIYPGAPWLHAWRDTLETSGRGAGGLAPIRLGLNKYSFPVRDRFATGPAELSHIFLLSEHNRDEAIVEAVRGGEKLESLLRQAFFVETIPDKMGHFKLCAAAASFPIIRLSFNRIPGNAERVADLILKESAP